MSTSTPSLPHRRRSQRGQAMSVFIVGVTATLILVAGLVVDGGQKASAISRAESVAAGAARAAANSGAGGTLSPGSSRNLSTASAREAAESYLAGAAEGSGPQVSGTATVQGSTVVVHTTVTVRTIFLSVIGIDTLTGTGDATARVVPT